jgi:predicted nucleic acid-binding protein
VIRVVLDANVLVSAALGRDPAAPYLVALARAARVDALVTGDRDLLVLEDIGVAVITPRALVEELADAR